MSNSELKKLRELTETLTGNGYLRDQAGEWEYALDAIPNYIYIVNNKFEIKFVNQALANKLKIEKQDVYGKVCTSSEIGCVMSGHICESCEAVIDNPQVHDIFLFNLGGWYNITRSPIYTTTKKLIGFICVFQDITAQKDACVDVEQSEEKFSSIMELSNSPVFIFNLKTKAVLEVNFAFEKTFKLHGRNIVGKGIDDLNIWANECDGKRFCSILEGKGKVNNLTFLLKDSNNGVHDYRISASVIPANNNTQVVCMLDKSACFN